MPYSFNLLSCRIVFTSTIANCIRLTPYFVAFNYKTKNIFHLGTNPIKKNSTCNVWKVYQLNTCPFKDSWSHQLGSLEFHCIQSSRQIIHIPYAKWCNNTLLQNLLLNDKNKSCSRRLWFWCIGEEFFFSLLASCLQPLSVVFLHYHYHCMRSFLLNMLLIMLLQAINIFSEPKRSLEVKVKCIYKVMLMCLYFF